LQPQDADDTLPRGLEVEGMLCDVVQEVGSALVGVETPLEQDIQQKALSSWFVEASKMATLVQKPNASKVVSVNEKFVSVLLMGRTTEEFLSVDENEGVSDEQFYILRFARTAEHKAKMHHNISFRDYLQSFPNVQGRVFFITEANSTGIAPPTTRKGDLVAVFNGFDVPVILRPGSDGGYVFVGECYAEMDVTLPRKIMYNEDISNSEASRHKTWQKILLF
jgi:hypothetical protein